MPTAPDFPELARPAQRRGRMSELADVEEVPVRLEVNDRPVLTGVLAVPAEGRRAVLASGCGAVSTFLAVSGTPRRHGAGAAGAE
jgi:hypothetical protein